MRTGCLLSPSYPRGVCMSICPIVYHKCRVCASCGNASFVRSPTESCRPRHSQRKSVKRRFATESARFFTVKKCAAHHNHLAAQCPDGKIHYLNERAGAGMSSASPVHSSGLASTFPGAAQRIARCATQVTPDRSMASAPVITRRLCQALLDPGVSRASQRLLPG